MEIFTGHFLGALLEVMLVNIVLSGDNAVVIALAARNLPPHHRRLAIIWGANHHTRYLKHDRGGTSYSCVSAADGQRLSMTTFIEQPSAPLTIVLERSFQ